MKSSRRRAILRHLLVLGIFFAVHLVIFRDVVREMPAIWQGDKAIAQHELIPFFDWNTQFASQILNNYTDLTSTDEMRLSYTFWASWMRHFAILPVALVIANTLAGFLFYWAVYIISDAIFEDNRFICISALSAALSIHLFILYLKLVHFYVLGIGFALFALSLSLTIRYLFLSYTASTRQLIVLALIVLINPATHFHVLYYVSLSIFFVICTSWALLGTKINLNHILRQWVRLSLVILLVAFIPYVLYIQYIVSLQSTSISNTISISYWMLDANSLDWSLALTMESTSSISHFLTGQYLIEDLSETRLILVIATLIIMASAFFTRLFRNHRHMITFFMVFFSLSTWLSVGYGNSLSFHTLLRNIALHIHQASSAWLDPLLTVMFTLVQILRFSHRFSFLQFYALGVMMALALRALLTLSQHIIKRGLYRRSVYLMAACLPIILLNWDQQAVILSGNFDGFVQPYTIPDDLEQIKAILAEEDEGNLFILPSMETARVLYDEQHANYYNFIDKFFIYYLNSPTYYYGVGATQTNKRVAYLAYLAILKDEVWWLDVLNYNADVKYLLHLKTLQPRPSGLATLPVLPTLTTIRIKSAVANEELYPLYTGTQFDLYAIAQPSPQGSPVLIDQRWSTLIATLQSRAIRELDVNQAFVPSQIHHYLAKPGNHYLLTDDVSHAAYDVYASLHPDQVFVVDRRTIPFDGELISSATYTSVVSMFVTQQSEYSYNHFDAYFPAWPNILSEGGVIGTRHKPIPISITVEQNGTYRLLLRGYYPHPRLSFTLDEQTYFLEKQSGVDTADNLVDLYYFAVDLELPRGQHKLTLNESYHDGELLLIDMLLAMPMEHLPASFNSSELNFDKFAIRKTKYPELYEVELFRSTN